MEFGDRDDISIGFLLLFCALPSLTAGKIQMGFEEEWVVPSPAPQYNVEQLDITSSNLIPESLIDILRCFPRLKKFNYNNGAVLPDYMGRGIAHLHHCLEDLTVIDEESLMCEYDEPASLAEFVKLKKIDMRYEYLLKKAFEGDKDELGAEGQPRLADMLLHSVEQLAIWEHESDILVQLRDVLDERKMGLWGGLRSVDFGFAEELYSVTQPETMQELKRIEDAFVADAKAMGVNIIVCRSQEKWFGGRGAYFLR